MLVCAEDGTGGEGVAAGAGAYCMPLVASPMVPERGGGGAVGLNMPGPEVEEEVVEVVVEEEEEEEAEEEYEEELGCWYDCCCCCCCCWWYDVAGVFCAAYGFEAGAAAGAP